MLNAVKLSQKINANTAPESIRSELLPNFLGRHFSAVESTIYTLMGQYCRSYDGGYWHFEVLSNQGFFLRLDCDVRLEIENDDNNYRGRMSAEAASITVCLCAYSILSLTYKSEKIGEQFHLLHEYASQHKEASAIFACIG